MSTISVDYDVLNQKGSPAWFSDTFANIPTFGYKGRMFISIDTFAFYRDTGTGWDLIGGPGIGTLTGSGATGQVSFFNGTQVLTGNNNLFWDNTNSRLGINTATPGQALDIHSTANTLVQLNNTTTGDSIISFQNQSVTKWKIGNLYNAGANSFDITNPILATTPFSISSAGAITLATNVTTTGAQFVQNGLYLTNANAGALAFYTNMWARNEGVNFALRNLTGGAGFIFQSAASYDYTFPASAGTLALTSNLSAYLPLAGGTLTGALTGTSATFSGVVTANGTSAFSGYGLTTKGTYGLYVQRGSVNDSGVEIYHDGTNAIFGSTYQSTGSFGGMLFYTGGAERMRITSGGNVGIGTATPSTAGGAYTGLDIRGSGGGSIYLGTAATAFGLLYADSSGYNIQSGNVPIIFYPNGIERMRISANGFILLGTFTYNNTTTNLPNTFIDTTGGVYRSTTSSIKVKDNILDWNGNGLDTILALKPKTFTYKESYYKHPELEMLGLIAEEVAEVSSYLAEYENEDRTGEVKNVKYAIIVVPLIKAIQEQQAQIEELKAQLNLTLV